MHTSIRKAALLAALTLAASAALAQAPTQAPAGTPGTSTPAASKTLGTPKPASSPATTDRNFILKAAQSDIAEIQGGKTAQSNASSDGVKKFAAQMVADHTKTSDQLKPMAQSRGVPLPAAPSAKDERDMKKMSELSGADFDRAYMASQVRAHRDAVSLFRNEAKSGKDAELKSFAAATLPALEGHLKMATDLAKTTSSGNRGASQKSQK